MRFLLSRRWLLFAVAVAVLAYGCWWLGEWQFHRLDDRRESNAQTRQNLEGAPVPVDDVLAVGEGVADSEEWQKVSATGAYLPGSRVIVRYQTRNGESGVDVVTPLRVASSGRLLLVDRGWLATDNAGDATPDVPDPPPGTVRVVGWVRADATGDSTVVTDGSTRAISSETISPGLDAPVYGGWVDLVSEKPTPTLALRRAEMPDLGEGPHFFYGLQWWFFAALAVFGFGYLAWDERRKLRRPGSRDRPEPALEHDRPTPS